MFTGSKHLKQIQTGFGMFLDVLGILLPLVIGIMSGAMIRIPKNEPTSISWNVECHNSLVFQIPCEDGREVTLNNLQGGPSTPIVISGVIIKMAL